MPIRVNHLLILFISVKNHKDKHYSNESLLLFGNGDGGGGPLSSMLERLDRMKDVNGLPQVQYGDPSTFFDRLAKNADDLVEWHGELVCFTMQRRCFTSDTCLLTTVL